MKALIYGGSGSGKSSFAEKLVMDLNTKNKIYLATMEVYDDEGRKKVERHHELRKGKGFETIEAPRDILENISISESKADTTLLLECMSNLVANEMFRDNQIIEETMVVEKVSREIKKLISDYKNVVIVSNNIFEDGATYDKTTLDYMRALSKIIKNIAKECDRVWEIVAGIPVNLK